MPPSISARIREVRLDSGLTQREVASASGLAHSTVSRIECGHVLPTLATLERMAAAMGTTIAAFTQEKADGSGDDS